jgi:hypothetical protein
MGKHALGRRTVTRKRTLRGLAVVAATVLASVALPFSGVPFAVATAGDPVVVLQDGTNGCNGVVATPGSENTTKRLVSGDLEPGGTVTFQIGYPVSADDVAGRTTFVITDCVFIGDKAIAKYEVSFVPNTENFLLTYQLVIPADAPIGAQYCNYAKTTAAPSDSQASNRKANPACFFIGGDLRIIKVAIGDNTLTPLAGASFTVACATASGGETIPPVVISGLDGSTTFSSGSYRASGTAATGIIGIAGPEGTVCTVTETAAPPGYDLPADSTFEFTIPAAKAGQDVEYIADPKTPNTTSLSTKATSGSVGDEVSDTATLSGATDGAGATITFNLYGPSDTPDCTGDAVFTSTVDVDGNGDYVSGGFTPSTAGSYYWIASYSGDADNKPSSEACGAEGETSGLEIGATSVTPSPSHSISGVVASQPPIAATGAGPVQDEITWALALLVFGTGMALLGRRRGYRRMH